MGGTVRAMVNTVLRSGRVYAVSCQLVDVQSAPVKAGSDKLKKYADKGGSRNGRGRGGHSTEPNPNSKVNYKLRVYRCLSMIKQ